MKRRHVYDPSLRGPAENARCVVCGAPRLHPIHQPRRRRKPAGIKPVERTS
jgi:hypothetical protein